MTSEQRFEEGEQVSFAAVRTAEGEASAGTATPLIPQRKLASVTASFSRERCMCSWVICASEMELTEVDNAMYVSFISCLTVFYSYITHCNRWATQTCSLRNICTWLHSSF